MSRPSLIPTFTTAVNTWQCDENDHLNVQFYTEFGHEASAHLLAEFGLGPRAQRAAGLDVRAASDHIRYLREFREVDPVEVLSAPVEVGERHLLAYHEIRNPSDGTVASTMRRRIVCDRAVARRVPRARRGGDRWRCRTNARPRSVGTLALPDLALGDAARMRPDRSRPHAWSRPPNATSAASSCRTISSAAIPTARRCCGTISASTARRCRSARKARSWSRC